MPQLSSQPGTAVNDSFPQLIWQLDPIRVFLFAIVFLGENLFEPVSLALGDSFVHEHGIVKDEKFFTAAIAAKTAHFLEVLRCLLAQLPFLNCDRRHGECGNSTYTRSTHAMVMIFLMCGRYRLSRRRQLGEEYFDPSGEDDGPRDNIAPTQPVAVVRQPENSGRKLSCGERRRARGG